MTVDFKIYKLKFSAPLHLSVGKENYDKSAKVLHSDTLKSAILSCAYLLGYSDDKVNEILDKCIFSSAYPFYRNEYFFPKPFVKIQTIDGVEEEKQGKPLKKIQYIGKSYFEKLLIGNGGKILQGHLFDGGAFVSDHTDLKQLKRKSIITSSVNQRVTIAPDYIEEAVPFYTERLFFSDEAGFWLIIQCEDAAVEEKVDGLMRLLGDNGIGTDRSVGNGFFDVEKSTLTINTPDNATHQTNLSLFCPTKDELGEDLLNDSSWQLQKRGGYIAGASNEKNITLRKHSIYMFEEGSVFPNQSLQGKVVDLRPKINDIQHSVWRDGRSIFLPIQPQD